MNNGRSGSLRDQQPAGRFPYPPAFQGIAHPGPKSLCTKRISISVGTALAFKSKVCEGSSREFDLLSYCPLYCYDQILVS